MRRSTLAPFAALLLLTAIGCSTPASSPSVSPSVSSSPVGAACPTFKVDGIGYRASLAMAAVFADLDPFSSIEIANELILTDGLTGSGIDQHTGELASAFAAAARAAGVEVVDDESLDSVSISRVLSISDEGLDYVLQLDLALTGNGSLSTCGEGASQILGGVGAVQSRTILGRASISNWVGGRCSEGPIKLGEESKHPVKGVVNGTITIGTAQMTVGETNADWQTWPDGTVSGWSQAELDGYFAQYCSGS